MITMVVVTAPAHEALLRFPVESLRADVARLALRVVRAFRDRDRDGFLVFFVCIILFCVAAAVDSFTNLLVAAAPVVMLASGVTIARPTANTSRRVVAQWGGAGGAEQYNANKKYKESVAVAAEACAEATKGQTCYICLQAVHSRTGEGLVRGCACGDRDGVASGRTGVAHVSCLAEQAKILFAVVLASDGCATLDDIREAVTTLEDAGRIARRVLGGAHPITMGIEATLREARAALRARETPPGSA